MATDHQKTSISDAIDIAAKYAGIFAAGLLIFLFGSIAMVNGDGTAPGISHLSAGILDFTVKLLGISSNGSILAVVAFWAAIVFALVFIFLLLRTNNENE